jgi:hypothetical protein
VFEKTGSFCRELTQKNTMKTEPELIEFEEQNVIFAKDQPEYRPLPAYRHLDDPEGKIVCCWKFGWWDRFKILFNGRIWHMIMTFNKPLQPQLILADKPTMPKVFSGDKRTARRAVPT